MTDLYYIQPAGAPPPTPVPVTREEMIALFLAARAENERYLLTAFGRLVVYVTLPEHQWVLDVLKEMRS